MTDLIVQKLVTALGFKILDQNILKRYDASILASQSKYLKGNIKAQNAVAIGEAKVSAIRETVANKLAVAMTNIESKSADNSIKVNSRMEEVKLELSQSASLAKEKLLQNQGQFEANQSRMSIALAESAARAKDRIDEAAQRRAFSRASSTEAKINRAMARMARRRAAANAGMSSSDMMGLGLMAGMANRMLGGEIKKSGSEFGNVEAEQLRQKAQTSWAKPSQKSLDKLKKQALDLSTSTQFSLLEISEAQTSASGQHFTPDQIHGMTPSALNVSAITKKTPEDSIRLMAEMMHMWSMSPTKSSFEKVANLIGGAKGSMGLDPSKLENVLKYAGALSKIAGIGPEAATAIAVTAQKRALTGTSAGTGFARTILDIGAGRKNKALLAAGVDPKHIFDTQGNMDIIGLLTLLQKQSHKFSTGQNLRNANDLFGKTAVKFGLGIMASTEKDKKGQLTVMDAKKQLESANAAKTASELNKGYNYNIKLLTSSIEKLQAVIGEKLAPKLETLANFTQKVSDTISDANPTIKELIADLLLAGFAVTGLAATIWGFKFIGSQFAGMGGFFSGLVGKIGKATTAMLEFDYAALAGPAAFTALGAAIAFLGYEIYRMWTGHKTIIGDFVAWVNKKLKKLFGIDMDAIFDTAYSKWSEWIDKIKKIFSGFGTFIEETLGKIGLINVTPTVNLPKGGNIYVTNNNDIVTNNHGSHANNQKTGNVVANTINNMTRTDLRNAAILVK